MVYRFQLAGSFESPLPAYVICTLKHHVLAHLLFNTIRASNKFGSRSGPTFLIWVQTAAVSNVISRRESLLSKKKFTYHCRD